MLLAVNAWLERCESFFFGDVTTGKLAAHALLNNFLPCCCDQLQVNSMLSQNNRETRKLEGKGLSRSGRGNQEGNGRGIGLNTLYTISEIIHEESVSRHDSPLSSSSFIIMIWLRISPSSPGWPGTHTAKSGLELACDSSVLGLFQHEPPRLASLLNTMKNSFVLNIRIYPL